MDLDLKDFIEELKGEHLDVYSLNPSYDKIAIYHLNITLRAIIKELEEVLEVDGSSYTRDKIDKFNQILENLNK